MGPIEYIYHNIWLWSTFLFCLIAFAKYCGSNRSTLVYRKSPHSTITFIYCILFAFWMGFRPVQKEAWADTLTYRLMYNSLKGDHSISDELIIDTNSEWLWDFMQRNFVVANVPVEWFFFFVECGYIGFMYLGIRRMIPCNQWLTLLFCISSFSFLSFSYNGLRNGLACSIILYAISFLIKFDKKDLLWGILLSFIAVGIHRSTALPALCALIAWLFKFDFKWAYSFWILSIFISLLVGEQVQALFANIGFDDRMASYAGTTVANSEYAKNFSKTGFRWDFLLYSAMPIILGWYIVYKRKIKDRAYDLLIVTYTLANSFWVMVIQSTNSNRFAYLSWFMYPIVFAYPLLKVKIWKDQDRKTVQILMLYVLFTVFLNVIYW